MFAYPDPSTLGEAVGLLVVDVRLVLPEETLKVGGGALVDIVVGSYIGGVQSFSKYATTIATRADEVQTVNYRRADRKGRIAGAEWWYDVTRTRASLPLLWHWRQAERLQPMAVTAAARAATSEAWKEPPQAQCSSSS